VEFFPRSKAAVFERDLSAPLARVVGAANVPRDWRARVVNLHDMPPLDEALKYPERIIERTLRRRRNGGTNDSSGPVTVQTLWAAVPDSGGSQHALMLLGRPGPDETPMREAAVEITRRLLARNTSIDRSDRSRLLAAIHRAKREWEHTADALPEIVGLLDSRWRIVRVSRAVERWHLGGVREAIGRGLHSLVHPFCTDPSCPFQASLELATRELGRSRRASFEIADAALARDLIVSLDAAARRRHRIVFTVRNVTAVRAAERESKALHHTLEQRVAERTSELLEMNRVLHGEVRRRHEAEKSLRRSTRDLEALSERLMNAQEAERKRISQDMHDSVGQMLSAIKYSMEQAQLLSRRGAPDQACQVIEVAIRRLQRLMDEVRSISMNLRPALLDDLGAASAVRSLCRDWQDVYRAIEVETDIPVTDGDIPPILVTSVFRAVQESLNNVARHAGAQHVLVSIRIVNGVLRVAIRDDGIGFRIDGENSPTAGTRGLRGLRERAERTGGCCQVSSAPGQGTTVELEWPVAAGQAAQLANARLN
jgi:signal transduction histidine kinase